MANRKSNEETEPVVDDPVDNQSDYVVVDNALTLRRDAQERLSQQEGVTVVSADETREENT